jgi:hypothetical protein
MNIPQFTAEASLDQVEKPFYSAGQVREIRQTVQPAFIRSCRAICGGDLDCLQCCFCIRRGGHPSQCCDTL